MITIPTHVYVVWTLEDRDNVDIFFDEDQANALYLEYGEFGQWAEKTIPQEQYND